MRHSRAGRSSAFVQSCCGCFLALWAGSTHAQSDADKTRAELLFEDGKVAFDKQNYAAACPKFEESYELVKGVGAQYFLARCLTEQNRTATAYRHFEEVAEISARVGQQERADVAKQRMAELEPRLMKIRIDVTAREPGLEVACDGSTIPEASWGKPIAFDPGAHLVRVRAPGERQWQRQVELRSEGSIVTVVVPDLAPQSPPHEGNDLSGGEEQGLFISGLAVGGLGLAGVVIGGALAGVATATYDDSNAFCDDTGCDQQGLDLVDDARSLGDGATAMFIVGGALLAGGTAMIVVSFIQDGDASAAVPEITWGLAAATARWRF